MSEEKPKAAFDREPIKELDLREQQEIEYAVTYRHHFNHGTGSHLAYTVIAKLYDLLTEKQ